MTFEPLLDPQFKTDLAYWRNHDPKIAARLMRIFSEILRTPFEGIGKPEPLRGALTGQWSRRLTHEHRVVYRVTERSVIFMSARHHYKD